MPPKTTKLPLKLVLSIATCINIIYISAVSFILADERRYSTDMCECMQLVLKKKSTCMCIRMWR